jgi:hypothetical protein
VSEPPGFHFSPRNSIRAVRVAEVATRQGGVISVDQLRRSISAPTISRWMGAGRLHQVHPRVYAVGHQALGMIGRLHAALLYAGDGAALSHQTAGWWWRLLAVEPTTIHVSEPGERADQPGLAIHHPRKVAAVEHRGLPVTPVPRTLRDLFWVLPQPQAQKALAEADFRGLLDSVAVYAELGRGRRGSTALRAGMATLLPELAATFSILEERFLALIADAHLPMPEVNARVEGLLVDCVWRERSLVVELDGHRTHAKATAIERDRHREMRLRRAGHTVLRYTWQQITREGHLVIAELRERLSATELPGSNNGG